MDPRYRAGRHPRTASAAISGSSASSDFEMRLPRRPTTAAIATKFLRQMQTTDGSRRGRRPRCSRRCASGRARRGTTRGGRAPSFLRASRGRTATGCWARRQARWRAWRSASAEAAAGADGVARRDRVDLRLALRPVPRNAPCLCDLLALGERGVAARGAGAAHHARRRRADDLGAHAPAAAAARGERRRGGGPRRPRGRRRRRRSPRRRARRGDRPPARQSAPQFDDDDDVDAPARRRPAQQADSWQAVRERYVDAPSGGGGVVAEVRSGPRRRPARRGTR